MASFINLYSFGSCSLKLIKYNSSLALTDEYPQGKPDYHIRHIFTSTGIGVKKTPSPIN